jgi:hypothetical protein
VRRYTVTTPTHSGNAWWSIEDTQSIESDKSVARFAVSMPNAEPEAHTLCYRLNTHDPARAC